MLVVFAHRWKPSSVADVQKETSYVLSKCIQQNVLIIIISYRSLGSRSRFLSYIYRVILVSNIRVYERMHLESCECNYVLSTSKHFFRMHLVRSTNFDSHPTHPSHRIRESVSKCSSHRLLYTGTLHPLPPLFMRHHTHLFLFIVIFIVISCLFEDVITSSVGRQSVVVSSSCI